MGNKFFLPTSVCLKLNSCLRGNMCINKNRICLVYKFKCNLDSLLHISCIIIKGAAGMYRNRYVPRGKISFLPMMNFPPLSLLTVAGTTTTGVRQRIEPRLVALNSQGRGLQSPVGILDRIDRDRERVHR